MTVIEKAEEILLGTILSVQEFQEIIISELNKDLFTIYANKIVFGCIKNLQEKGSGIDILTVTNGLSKQESEEIGGAYYVSKLTSNVGTGTNYIESVMILKEHYIRTNLVTVFNEEIVRLTDRTHDIEETNIKIIKTLENLFNISTGDNTQIYDIISKRLDNYSTIEPGKLLGLNTGHSKLNKITNGWQAGDLIILAARPSMGKTAISLLFAKYPALEGKKVLYFSLEMPKERLADRIISLETNINSNKLQAGKIEDYEWEQLDIKTGKFRNIPLLINDDSGLTIEQIKASSLKEMTKGDIDLILVDYIQLVNYTGNSSPNVEVGHISKNLKGIAKKCNCPVIGLGQLSRDVEKRGGDKRPVLSDLRDSGTLEQDADVVMFLYRPEYYGYTEDENQESVTNLIEIDIKKNRNGALGSTSFYKNEDWSYIGELPFEEYNSFDMPFSVSEGIRPDF